MWEDYGSPMGAEWWSMISNVDNIYPASANEGLWWSMAGP